MKSVEHLDGNDSEAILTALSDAQSRAILGATATEPLSVGELIELYDIPTATAYRKVNRLSELGLLAERVRINPNGPNTTAYELRVKAISVTLTMTVHPEVSCSMMPLVDTPADRGRDDSITRWAVTDGGEETETPPRDERPQVFEYYVDLTGTERFVDR